MAQFLREIDIRLDGSKLLNKCWNHTFDKGSLENSAKSGNVRSSSCQLIKKRRPSEKLDHPTHPTLSLVLKIEIISRKCSRAEGTSAQDTLSRAGGISTVDDPLPAQEVSCNPT